MMNYPGSKLSKLFLLKVLGLTVMLGQVLGAQAVLAMESPGDDSSLKDFAWDRLKSWQLDAQSGYAFAGSMNGWGLGAGAQWFPLRYLGVGAVVDSARIQVEGKDPKFVFDNGGAFAFGLRSTFVGAGLVGRLPIHRLTLSAQIDLGHVWTTTVENKNVVCSFQGGTMIATVVGLQYQVHRRIHVGLDWRVRGHSVSESCANGSEGASLLPLDPLMQVSLAVAYRFFD
jgi:hypothetical protein